jgi:hypothetical protein
LIFHPIPFPTKSILLTFLAHPQNLGKSHFKVGRISFDLGFPTLFHNASDLHRKPFD